MIYDASNVEIPCTVFDVQRCVEVREVLSVDTDRLLVTAARVPFRVIGGTEISTYTIRAENIRAISGKSGLPVLFLLNSVDEEGMHDESERNTNFA